LNFSRCNNPASQFDTFGSKENRITAGDITLDEKERRCDAALDKFQRTVEEGGGALNETIDEFLGGADD
jgi:hypothetical protein